jgi:hypothetical protein
MKLGLSDKLANYLGKRFANFFQNQIRVLIVTEMYSIFWPVIVSYYAVLITSYHIN